MFGSDSRNALSDLLRERLIEQRIGRDHRGAGAEADRAHRALRGDTDRRDPRRRRRGVDPEARGADHLHGAVPDLGADDVGLPDAGHGDREGEQGRRRAAGVGESRSDPRRQAARARRRGTAADCGVARHPHGDGPRRGADADLGEARRAVAGAGAGRAVLHHRVPVLRRPDARHRLARQQHERGAAAGDGLVADGGRCR